MTRMRGRPVRHRGSIEHSRKHGFHDPRWPRHAVSASPRRGELRRDGVESDAFLLTALATWESEGGASCIERSEKRAATIAWCDAAIARTLAQGDVRLDQFRHDIQELRDRLVRSAPLGTRA
jgi:hypothetical protein